MIGPIPSWYVPCDLVCIMTSGMNDVRKNQYRLNVNLKLAQSCLYSKASSMSPLTSTSLLKYISWNVSIGIFDLPLYFCLSASFLKVR